MIPPWHRRQRPDRLVRHRNLSHPRSKVIRKNERRPSRAGVSFRRTIKKLLLRMFSLNNGAGAPF